MFFAKLGQIARSWRLHRIGQKVRKGVLPLGIPQEDIMEALKVTKPKGVMETWGFCSARVFDKFGKLKMDLGLQSVREVTVAATKIIADAFCNSAGVLDKFIYHAAGSGSTAETDTQTAMVSQCGIRRTGSQTHGATSNIFKTIVTITATSAYTAIEHGIFNTLADGTLLDRSLVGTPPTLTTDDEVEWTYNLTLNAGG